VNTYEFYYTNRTTRKVELPNDLAACDYAHAEGDHCLHWIKLTNYKTIPEKIDSIPGKNIFVFVLTAVATIIWIIFVADLLGYL